MIKRLMSPERPYGEPEYSKLSEQITKLQKALAKQLDYEHQVVLEQLSDTYIRQGNTMLADVFTDGFCTAIELMLDFFQHRPEHNRLH